jgi:YbbR domain-containing protein
VLNRIKTLFTNNLGLKLISLVLALMLWFYIVEELEKGSEDDMRFLNKVLPSEGVAAKKLLIRPVVVGRPKSGYVVSTENIITSPDYCIVVGTRGLLGKIRHAYTMPIDVAGAYKTITKSVPLNPIAPGVYMEETLVQVTVPIEKANP